MAQEPFLSAVVSAAYSDDDEAVVEAARALLATFEERTGRRGELVLGVVHQGNGQPFQNMMRMTADVMPRLVDSMRPHPEGPSLPPGGHRGCNCVTCVRLRPNAVS